MIKHILIGSSLIVSLNCYALSDKIILGTEFNSSIQGLLEKTDFRSDLAIAGEGYFPIRSKSGEVFYTRQGTIGINEKNHLIHKLSGYELLTLNDEGALVPIDLNGKSRKALRSELSSGDENKQTVLTAWALVDGKFVGLYADGTDVPIGKITLAAFQNQRKLKIHNRSKHILKYSKAAGDVAYAEPTADGMGRVYSHSLEQLNNDLYKKNYD